MGDTPDRRTTVGKLNIDLWRGFLRDEVRVWKDVHPAIGGLISSKSVWKWGARGNRLFDETVVEVRSLLGAAKHSRFCSAGGWPCPIRCETWPDTFVEMFPNLPGAEELDRKHPDG